MTSVATANSLGVRPSRAFAVALLVDGPVVLDLAQRNPWASDTRGSNQATAAVLTALAHVANRATTIEQAATEAAQAIGTDAAAVVAELQTLADKGVLVEADPPATATPAQRIASKPVLVATPEDTAAQILTTPTLVGLDEHGYSIRNHDGDVVAQLDPIELLFAATFGRQRSVQEALTEFAVANPSLPFGPDRAADVVGRLRDAGVLCTYEPDNPAHIGSHGRQERELRAGISAFFRHRNVLAKAIADHEAEELEREAQTGVHRTRVLPVERSGHTSPLALGMLIAYAKTVDGGRLNEHFDLFPRWIQNEDDVAAAATEPSIYLFSNYIWSHNSNVELSAHAKERSPNSVTIHGGPDAPRGRRDVDNYLRKHQHIDIVVKGEGEATFIELMTALEGAVGDHAPDFSRLKDVDGISYRDGDRIVHCGERDRIADMDAIGSPYLEGVFDTFAEAGAMGFAIFETNRGCPYSCTYCDWGAATNSRIRQFELDRIMAELEWCAKAKIPFFSFADANFGILKRDVEIAQKVADLHAEYGYPKRFATNFAKNTVKHLKQIIEIITGAGIHTEGLLSLQAMDEATLEAIHRSNIKLEKYEDLATSFRRAGLPLFVDLMMGLPGQSLVSFTNDVQQCINREVTGKIFGTEMLVNSPMNDPEYRALHGIELIREPGPTDAAADREHAFVVATATFTREDYLAMNRLRRTFFLAENHGMLRQISRLVRHQLGMREVDLLTKLNDLATSDRERFPTISLALLAVPDLLAPPISWGLFIAELRTFVVDELGMPDDTALQTALTVQHAMLPTPGRVFPQHYELAHDYVAWHTAMVEAKEAGHLDDWEKHVPALASFPPAVFTVEDVDSVCELSLGYSVELDTSTSWELTTEISRAMPAAFGMIN